MSHLNHAGEHQFSVHGQFSLVVINAQGEIETIHAEQPVPEDALLLGYLNESGQLVLLQPTFEQQEAQLQALVLNDTASSQLDQQALQAIEQFIQQGGSPEQIASPTSSEVDWVSSSIAVTGTIDATREERLPDSFFETQAQPTLPYELDDNNITFRNSDSNPVQIIAENQPPTAAREERTYIEESDNNPLNITLPSDPNGDALLITVTELPTLGFVTLADGTPITLGQTLTLEQLENLVYNAPEDYETDAVAGHFAYSVDDGSGGITEGKVEILLEPINDVPIFTGSDAGEVVEDASDPLLTHTSQLVVMDADSNESKIKPGDGQPQGEVLGSLTIDSDGFGTYTVDNALVQYLGEGETRQEVFQVESEDGTFHDITVTIYGVNDPSKLPCDCQAEPGLVIEGSADILKESGQLTITDPDGADEALFVPETVQADPGTLGTLTITPEGAWHYQVDNALVSYLEQGQVKEERFTVESIDGTEHEVVVAILGTDFAQDDLSDLLDGIGDQLGDNDNFDQFDQQELDFLVDHPDHIGNQPDPSDDLSLLFDWPVNGAQEPPNPTELTNEEGEQLQTPLSRLDLFIDENALLPLGEQNAPLSLEDAPQRPDGEMSHSMPSLSVALNTASFPLEHQLTQSAQDDHLNSAMRASLE